MNLYKFRFKIISIDLKIIKLLRKRFFIVKKIQKLKQKENKTIYRRKYEDFLLKKYAPESTFFQKYIKTVFKTIFNCSKKIQKELSSSEEK
ncbi:MAG: chorismate mutase [Candidatus Muiribacteriota bacterium]